MYIPKEIKEAGEYLQSSRNSIKLSQSKFPVEVNKWLKENDFKSRTCKRTVQQQEQGQRDVRGTTNAIKVAIAKVTGADIKGFYSEEENKALRFLVELVIESDTGIKKSYNEICNNIKNK